MRRALKGAAAAAEAADATSFLSFFTSDYSDFMHPGRAAFEATLGEGFSRVDRMNVTLTLVEIEVTGTDARVVLDAVVVAIRGEERYVVLGQPFEPERLHVRLRREDGRWKIRRVEIPSL